MAGYVYAFATPSMAGIVKIGATTHDPAARLADANSADTWRPPEPYELVCSAHGAHELRPRSRWSARSTRSSARDASTRAASSSAPLSSRRAVYSRFSRTSKPPVRVQSTRRAMPLTSPLSAYGRAHERHPECRLEWASSRGKVSYCKEACLRSWVESKYARIPLREKDTGSKLEALHPTYATAVPQVHAKLMGKTTFGKMLSAVYPGVGPHRNGACTVSGLYLLR